MCHNLITLTLTGTSGGFRKITGKGDLESVCTMGTSLVVDVPLVLVMAVEKPELQLGSFLVEGQSFGAGITCAPTNHADQPCTWYIPEPSLVSHVSH